MMNEVLKLYGLVVDFEYVTTQCREFGCLRGQWSRSPQMSSQYSINYTGLLSTKFGLQEASTDPRILLSTPSKSFHCYNQIVRR